MSSTTTPENESPDIALYLLALLIVLSGAYCLLSGVLKLPDILAIPLAVVLLALTVGAYQHRISNS